MATSNPRAGSTIDMGIADVEGSAGGVVAPDGDVLPASPLPPSSLASRELGGLRYPPGLKGRKGRGLAVDVGEKGRWPSLGDEEAEEEADDEEDDKYEDDTYNAPIEERE